MRLPASVLPPRRLCPPPRNATIQAGCNIVAILPHRCIRFGLENQPQQVACAGSARLAQCPTALQVEVFRRLYESVGLGWVYAVTKVPAVGRAADAVYDVWAKYRLPITGRPGLVEVMRTREEAGCRPAREAAAAADADKEAVPTRDTRPGSTDGR